jgi:flagellar basal-body rod protein FlgC
MSLLSSFAISASGLAVQRKRIDVASENLANVDSTRTPEGGPYKEKQVVVSSVPISFDESLKTFLSPDQVQGAEVVKVQSSDKPPRVIYNPGHPDADSNGNVAMPDISSTEELINIMTASKTYEANVTTFNAAKSMVLRTLDIGVV